MQKKKASTETSWEIVFPNDANSYGTMFGGRLMGMMDIIAAIAASRYAGKPTVTASTEAIDFLEPVQVGDRVESFARVVWVGKTSMIVKVEVYAENPSTSERVNCTTAHFTFVALDENRRPTAVPPLLIETDEEKKEFELAELIKQKAIARKSLTKGS